MNTASAEDTAAFAELMNQRAARKGNQFRALGYKALSYQKRQVFTNICCISLCPLFMVAISGILGTVISNLIQNTSPIEDILYCGNNNSLLASTGFPIFNASDSRVFGFQQKAKSVNFIFVLNLAGQSGPPGATLLNVNNPCAYWFGADYPANSPIYEKNADAPLASKLDSTYVPPPDGGWFSVLSNAANLPPLDLNSQISAFSRLQKKQWVIYGSRPELRGILGERPEQEPVSLSGVPGFLAGLNRANVSYPSYTTTKRPDGSYGILGSIEGRYYTNFTLDFTSSSGGGFAGLNRVPYYVPVDGGIANPDRLDEELNNRFQDLLNSLAQLNKTALSGGTSRNNADLIRFQVEASARTAIMPYGAIYLDAFDASTLSARAIVQFGRDRRLDAAASFPTQGIRQFMQVTQLSQAFLRAFNPSFASATITQGVRAFPSLQSTKFDLPFGGLIGRILYPFGVSFLLPIFVIVLVKEKEDRILMMMKMNGMKAYAYYISHYITFYVLFAISTIIFLIAGRFFRLDFFTKTEISVLAIMFFFWGHVQIALAFFFASIFNKNRIALVTVFLLVLCSVIIAIVLDQLFVNGQVPTALFIWPPFAFYRALSVMNNASFNKLLVPYNLSMLKPGDEVFNSLLFMVFETVVFFCLSFYLSAVLPSDFGVRKPWHYPITEPLEAYQRAQRKKANGGVDPLSESNLAVQVKIDDEETKFEDADVKAERDRISRGEYDHTSPLVVSHMRKVYAGRRGLGPKLAVKDVTFAAEQGVIFGLLGPNGAGKTTLISILTGLYEASSGNATLAGFNYKSEQQSVYKVIGVCPQFDILWDELTVGEHLYFYARLKGIPKKEEKLAVAKALENVSLTTLENRKTKGLSGGEKRRLSIAIALIGDPAVVFLDEPTTGLDPEVRRLIWNIVQNAREGKTIILTTHSMEEAEALCQRIGIMAKGTLRCLSNPIRLKDLYGSGFKLFFNSNEEDMERAGAWIESLLPRGWTKVDAFATNTSYEFPPAAGVISYLFNTIEAGKEQNGILDWGISQTTLEEVFLRIISDDDANAD
ncbi:hypothetical protein HDU67_002781 [Dinochytrium kinnereticum]|nr:hypothetical protein HDU67_002781 [Dinochytrium kinnereticum]